MFRWTQTGLLIIGFVIVIGGMLQGHQLSAQEPTPRTITWSLPADLLRDGVRENPIVDTDGEPIWHFLRTTRSEGPAETRKWLRDGRYVLLKESGDSLFGLPLRGWIFERKEDLSPTVSIVLGENAGGMSVKKGGILLAPGPDHAGIVGWHSPVSGRLGMKASFEQVQSSNGIAWTIMQGAAPDAINGFESTRLAEGAWGSASRSAKASCEIEDVAVSAGDFLYFIVDALADGTATPHHGDGTRLDVKITVQDATSPSPPIFETDIAPLLARRCHRCHGTDLQEARLDLRTVSEILRGGENGPSIVREDPHASLLFDLVSTGQMPPDEKERLGPAEVSLIRRWIRTGALASETVVPLSLHSNVTDRDRSYWAFQKPQKEAIPPVQHRDRIRTPVDSFLLAKLEDKGLTFSTEADRNVLIRRASFDLTGLPPTPQEVQAFVDDDNADAYEILIERLLKSPHYGERWGRHWLDAAGYVDGKLDNDLGSIYPNNGIWRYRDYVIQSFNEDKPFDVFLTEQIAGDEMIDWRQAESFDARTLSLLTATGFLRNVDDHTDFPQYGIEKRYEVINETMDMLSTAVLGLTMECCRCHNHKFDPLPQRDYYRLMACFEPAFNVHLWKQPKERFLADVSPKERARIDSRNAEIDRQISELTKSEAATRQQVRQRVLDARIALIPEDVREAVKLALQLPSDQRNEQQKALLAQHPSVTKIADGDVDAALSDPEKVTLRASSDQRAALLSEKKTYGVIQALWDVGTPPASHVHRRGNVKAHGVLVQPGFPEILSGPSLSRPEAVAATEGIQGETSGRRFALARWLTQRDHPLTARVFVNRVWHHHFGRGIVETLGNFGHSGSLPTHQELLDWLSVDFMERGWSIKQLHRRIMLSSAYRQSSRRSVTTVTEPASSKSGDQIDPDNRLLWRMNLRRLEAEIVRDSILATSGALDRTTGGPPIEITNPPDGLSEVKTEVGPTAAHRRSLYLFARRVYPLKFLEIFDSPIMTVNCTQRMNSATVLQSLAVLNSEFLFVQAEQMADRVLRDGGADLKSQVCFAFQTAFARQPTNEELSLSEGFVESQIKASRLTESSDEKAVKAAMSDFCHMLLSSNEFLYVE